MAEEEGYPDFRIAKIHPVGLTPDRAALENAHAFSQLRALAGSNSSSTWLNVDVKQKKPHCWGSQSIMAEEEGFEPS